LCVWNIFVLKAHIWGTSSVVDILEWLQMVCCKFILFADVITFKSRGKKSAYLTSSIKTVRRKNALRIVHLVLFQEEDIGVWRRKSLGAPVLVQKGFFFFFFLC
jgi:hypothetical protein